MVEILGKMDLLEDSEVNTAEFDQIIDKVWVPNFFEKVESILSKYTIISFASMLFRTNTAKRLQDLSRNQWSTFLQQHHLWLANCLIDTSSKGLPDYFNMSSEKLKRLT